MISKTILETANELTIQESQPGPVEYRRLADGTIQIRERDNGDEWRTMYWHAHTILGQVLANPDVFGPFADWLRRNPGRIKLQTEISYAKRARKTLIIEIVSYEEED